MDEKEENKTASENDEVDARKLWGNARRYQGDDMKINCNVQCSYTLYIYEQNQITRIPGILKIVCCLLEMGFNHCFIFWDTLYV